MPRIDLTGKVYGRIRVLGFSHANSRCQSQWKCLCECGKSVVVDGDKLKTNKTRSCGCLRVEISAARQLIHGRTRRGKHDPMFMVWWAIKNRCYNQKTKGYKDYGGRGIGMCERWKDSFADFISDIESAIGSRPKGMTLDRADVDGHYEISNVRWADWHTQRMNQRRMKQRECAMVDV